MFSAPKSKCPRRLLEVRNLAHLFYEPLPTQPLTFFFLFRGNFGSSKTQIFQKKLEKKLNDWEGAYRTRVPIFGFRLQKNGVDIGCRTNLGRYA